MTTKLMHEGNGVVRPSVAAANRTETRWVQGFSARRNRNALSGKLTTMAYARNSQFRAPSGRTIIDWVTGTGFLAVDAGAFFVALMVLLPWNLYQSPGDLWVAQPLRSWAFILTFHALLVGAIALARGIVGSPDSETVAPPLGLRTSSDWSAPSQTIPQPNRSTASTLLAQEWARRWLADDKAEAAEMMQQSTEISARRAGVTYEPSASVDGTPWPEAPTPRAQSIDAEAILADWLDEQASEYVAPAPEGIDPLRSAARVSQGDTIDLEPEVEWKWVEAAASAWLSKRDVSPNGTTESTDHT